MSNQEWFQHPSLDISANHFFSLDTFNASVDFHPLVVKENKNLDPQYLLQLYQNLTTTQQKWLTLSYHPLYQQLFYLDATQYSYYQWIQKDYYLRHFLIKQSISTLDLSQNNLQYVDKTETTTTKSISKTLDTGLGHTGNNIILDQGLNVGLDQQEGWTLHMRLLIQTQSGGEIDLWKMGDKENYLLWQYKQDQGAFSLSIYYRGNLVNTFTLANKLYLGQNTTSHVTIIYRYQKKFIGSFLANIATGGEISLFLNASQIHTRYITYQDQYIINYIYRDRTIPLQYTFNGDGSVVTHLEIIQKILSLSEIKVLVSDQIGLSKIKFDGNIIQSLNHTIKVFPISK